MDRCQRKYKIKSLNSLTQPCDENKLHFFIAFDGYGKEQLISGKQIPDFKTKLLRTRREIFNLGATCLAL